MSPYLKYLAAAALVVAGGGGVATVMLKQPDLGNLVGVESGETLLSAPFQVQVAFDHPGNSHTAAHHESQTSVCDFSVSQSVTCVAPSRGDLAWNNQAAAEAQLVVIDQDKVSLTVIGFYVEGQGGVAPVRNKAVLGAPGEAEPVVVQYGSADATADANKVSSAYSKTQLAVPATALGQTFSMPMQSKRHGDVWLYGILTISFLPMPAS